ncbi:carboxylesterase [Porphyrobacter sp. GA68]|uniref:alpha/beta hydrolase n=1 Tax=Porphyrobacter sp. GA68 TaxID=2883480 RepID=UPI001D18C381|nr:alpha/beta hydrolase [Porphyrobacter sp. GA68]
MSAVSHHAMSDGRRIAFRHLAGHGPTLVFLPGYMSDMAGSKATALAAWAEQRGQACLLLDYSGCGASTGEFAHGTLTKWRDEVVALVKARVAGSVLLIGSSMGGWLMLLAAEALGGQIAGMVGIAAAPDFTDWGFTPEQKAKLRAGEVVLKDNPYGFDPTPTHPVFWQDGERHALLNRTVAVDAPVHLLHGQRDPDVPWELSLHLAGRLRSDAVKVTLVKDGDHRLSRDEDIALLLRTVEAMHPAGEP